MKTRRYRVWGLAAVMVAAGWAAAETGSVESLLARARSRAWAGDDEPAAAAYREVLALDPGNREAEAFLARVDRRGRGDHWRTRAELLDDVAESWRRAPVVVETVPAEPASMGRRSALAHRLDMVRVPEVRFDGAGLSSVLATLSALAPESGDGPATDGRGVNLVLLDPGNTNPAVRLAVRDLPLRRVLDFVTDSVGYSYEVQDDAVVVRPGNGGAALETAVLPLSGAIVARMAAAGATMDDGATKIGRAETGAIAGGETAALRRFLQQAGVRFDGVEGASVVFDGSALLVTQTPANLARIRTILVRYNSVRQVEIEAKFLEVEDGALEELGVNWSVSRRKDATTGDPLETYITSNRSLADAFGGSSSGGAIQIDGTSVASVAAPVLPGEVPLASGTSPLGRISGFIGEFDVSATVRALAQKKGSDLLSAPKVTVISGHPASITVARQLRYPRQYGQIQSQVGQTGGESSGSAGVTITAGTPQDFVTENVGVDLQVTPVVEEDGRSITLDLHPVVTEFEGFVEYGGPSLAVSGGKTVTIPSGFYQPIFSKRSVSTRVMLWDGATLVMGGLTREETKTVTDKVPLLGDLPAVGRLFRSSGEGSTKRNLLIFVTASLVSPGGGLRKFVPVGPEVTALEHAAEPPATTESGVAVGAATDAARAKTKRTK